MGERRVHRCEKLSLADRTIVDKGDGIWTLVRFDRHGVLHNIRPVPERDLPEAKCPMCQADLEATTR